MNANAIETRELTRRYRGETALDGVSVSIKENVITGLLGRNGAGKTTLMSLITAQDLPSSGTVRVDGHAPFERAETIERMCFIRDNQRYPDDYRLHHALRAAAFSYPNWSQELADHLVEVFRIPRRTIVKKYSRGQLSALGIVLGLASRAPITFFDEPYLGLDATARGIFYDELLRDYAEHPRTIILSTHLIDEMDRLLERVIVLDRGRVVREADVDELRGEAFQIAGKLSDLDAFLAGREVLSRRTIGGLGTAIIGERPSDSVQAEARELGLELSGVSLQDLVAAYGLADEPGTASHPESDPTRAANAARTPERSAS
ncbi:ABC transporter ATP-binding protein [Leucobacter sp. CSA2]|uniref:ABC transporter ATP-binding protein n=1 Tax=Leucobacter edaphi TaxID=2796472 RepID=A0A934QDE7_9MICO|nr:ABC transporter ATP-binding protein [Leucobacter edaphi]MBK0422158.1 ABC transporter ATP-binding protein [Leucobacter edaphi]